MTGYRRIVFVLILWPAVFAVANDREFDVNELRELGRDALIEMAAARIIENDETGTFHKENFSRVKVQVIEESIYVSFDMPVRYVPSGSEYYYGASVELTGNTPSEVSPPLDRIRIRNPKNHHARSAVQYFIPDPALEKKILSLLRKIFPDTEIESISEIRFSDHADLLIREKALSYEVQQWSPYSYSAFKISKITGSTSNLVHESLSVDPDWEEEQTRIEEIQ
jgi:hypothetical protein